MNTYLRKIKKNSKALSPVIASIILIAVTVAVSVVVAAWMGGMTIGFMGNAEQVSITNIAFTAPDTISVMVTNSGSSTVTISTAFINGVQTTVGPATYPAPTPSPLPASPTLTKTTTITIALTNAADLSPGTSYQIKLITEKGTSIVNTATYNP
jgi:archaeal type IV pilus assembly protein PilA